MGNSQTTETESTPDNQTTNTNTRVFIYWGPGSYRGGRDETKIMFERKGIKVYPWITFAFLDNQKIGKGDILLFPGGSGHECAKNLQMKNKMDASSVRQKIKDYIANGVNYIGICAGSYLASNPEHDLGYDYFGIFPYNGDRYGGLNRGPVTLSIMSKYKSSKGGRNILYHQGPLFDGDIPHGFKVIATFEKVPDDFTDKEDYIGAPAILYKKGKDNNGNILLFSPHYEYGNNYKAAHIQFFKIVNKCFNKQIKTN